MAFDTTAAEGSVLFQAAALRGGSNNLLYNYPDRLTLAQSSADSYSTFLNEVSYVLLVALGKVKAGEDGEGDPVTLAREAAERIAELRKYENYFYTGDCDTECR